jgi:hypothetical protein
MVFRNAEMLIRGISVEMRLLCGLTEGEPFLTGWRDLPLVAAQSGSLPSSNQFQVKSVSVSWEK